MKRQHLFFALPLLAACAAATAQGLPSSQPAKPAASKPAALPVVEAKVRKVDDAQGRITLQHGEIPNLGMPAMTMVFVVADRQMLKGLTAGDPVRFQVDMVNHQATVVSIERRQ